MISVQTETTARASISTGRQRHILSVPAFAAGLAGVRWINSDDSFTGPFCLVFEESHELRPRCVKNRLSHAILVNNAVNTYVFNEDGCVSRYDGMAVLVRKISAAIRNSFVDSGNRPLLKFPNVGALRMNLHLSLGAGKSALLRLKKPRAGNNCAIAHRRECRESNIYPYMVALVEPCCDPFAMIDRKTGEPFSGPATTDTARLDGPIYWSMRHRFDGTNLGQLNAFCRYRKAGLRVTKGIISVHPAKSRESWRFPVLDSAIEGLESEVYTHSDILKYLGVDVFKGRTQPFQGGKFPMLFKKRDSGSLLDRFLAFLKQVIVKPPAFVERPFHDGSLTLGGVQAVSQC